MAQFINIQQLIPTIDQGDTQILQCIDHEFSSTMTHRAVRIIREELDTEVGYDPRATLPEIPAVELESLPDGWWHSQRCTQYIRYNRTDLY